MNRVIIFFSITAMSLFTLTGIAKAERVLTATPPWGSVKIIIDEAAFKHFSIIDVFARLRPGYDNMKWQVIQGHGSWQRTGGASSQYILAVKTDPNDKKKDNKGCLKVDFFMTHLNGTKDKIETLRPYMMWEYSNLGMLTYRPWNLAVIKWVSSCK